jgi:alpha-L-rhamnosidase
MNINSLNFVVIGVGLLLSGTLCGSALADTEESGGPESRETLLRPERLVSISGDVHAHFEAGDAAGALSLIRTVWGLHMTHDKPFYSGAVFETMALDGTPESPTRTLSHAWGSGPTSALSKYVLGVRPVEAGYQTWLIEPQPGDLTWAEGTVPTPHGPIGVAWYRKAAGGFSLGVRVPNGTLGTVGLPVAGANAQLSDNGKTVQGVSASQQPNGRTGYVYLADLGPGLHWIQVHP